MKKIFTLIGLFLCLHSYSQSVFKPASAYGEQRCAEFEIIVHSKFINKFSSTDLRFIRIQNTLASKWTAAYCDCELCHDYKTDTADFFIKIGDSCETAAHFYPDSTKGIGLMKIQVFAKNDPSKSVIGQYQASCWGASASFIESKKLAVSPNPANTVLNIGFGSGESYVISIVTTDGKIIAKERVESITNTMNISALNAGLYTVKIESAGEVYYSKFIKL
jgi:hypothetical protein